MSKKTYKVWVTIEEYDEKTGSGEECDAPGGAITSFDDYDSAYEFAGMVQDVGEALAPHAYIVPPSKRKKGGAK